MNEPYSIDDILILHSKILAVSGGSEGIRDMGLLESALAQPFMTFGGEFLYVTENQRAAALGFSMVRNHPFIDGNKRIAHAAMALHLRDRGFRIIASVEEQEELFLSLADGSRSREDLVVFLNVHVATLVDDSAKDFGP